MSEIAVGTKPWWGSSANSREEGAVAVTAVDGRRATLSKGAVLDLGNMKVIPDPISRGRCFASQDEHLSSQRLIDRPATVGNVLTVLELRSKADGAIAEVKLRVPTGSKVRDDAALRGLQKPSSSPRYVDGILPAPWWSASRHRVLC